MSVFALTGGRVVLDGRTVLDGVDLTVEPAEFIAVLGRNGSGKTTLVRTLVGLAPLAAGRLDILGTPRARFREWHRIGYVPQRLGAASGVPATVREVVESGRVGRRRLGRLRAADADAVDHALEDVGLLDRQRDPVATLSGGQQQRVLIARALAGEPDVLVLDEPTAGVDADSQDALATALSHLSHAGGSVVLVAHELGALEPLIGRAVVVEGGRLVYDGPPPREEDHSDHAEHLHPHPPEPAAAAWSAAAGPWGGRS